MSINQLGISYVSEKSVGNLFKETILEKIVTESPLKYLRKSFNSSVDTSIPVAVNEKKLILPIYSEFVKKGIKLGNNQITEISDFVFETLLPLNPQISANSNPVEMFGGDNYLKLMSEYGRSSKAIVKIHIERTAILKNFICLFDKLNVVHESGYVHCDLKPHNILLSEKGFVPIDSLNIEINTVSKGFTLDYCAPEQLLYKPVNQTTDMYNIGLLLASFIKCTIYGETKTFVAPIAGGINERTIFPTISQTERTIITNPEIFFYSGNQIIPDEYQKEWKDLLIKCLAFTPSDRFQSINELKKAFIPLIEKIKGSVVLYPDFGEFVSFKNDYGWLIRDVSTIQKVRCNNCGWENINNTIRCEKCNAPLKSPIVHHNEPKSKTGKTCYRCDTWNELAATNCINCGDSFTLKGI